MPKPPTNTRWIRAASSGRAWSRSKPDEGLDIPGESHLLTNLNFPIVALNCIGLPKRCAGLSNATASQALFRNRVDARLILHFYADGNASFDAKSMPSTMHNCTRLAVPRSIANTQR